MSGALPLIVFLVDSAPSWYPRNAAGLDFVKVGPRGEYPPQVRKAHERSGVYVIRDRGAVAYVGRATGGDLYKSATRHFQRWNRSAAARRDRPLSAHDPGRTYTRATGAVAIVPTAPNRAVARQRELIHELRPRDNVHHKRKAER